MGVGWVHYTWYDVIYGSQSVICSLGVLLTCILSKFESWHRVFVASFLALSIVAFGLEFSGGRETSVSILGGVYYTNHACLCLLEFQLDVSITESKSQCQS